MSTHLLVSSCCLTLLASWQTLGRWEIALAPFPTRSLSIVYSFENGHVLLPCCDFGVVARFFAGCVQFSIQNGFNMKHSDRLRAMDTQKNSSSFC